MVAICKRLGIDTKNADIVTSVLRFLANVYTIKANITLLGNEGLNIWRKAEN